MRPRSAGKDAQLRSELAAEAARAMAEGGITDFALAKRKAQERLRVPSGAPLPSNREIEDALHEHLRLFGGAERPRHVRALRAAAVTAMRELAAFKPRLVGPVLGGTADHHTPVTLHLFADSAEEVGLRLMDLGIPARDREHRLRMSTGDVERVPGFSFIAGEVEFDLLVFSGRTRGHTPLCPVDGGAMRRASRAEVEQLLCESAAGG